MYRFVWSVENSLRADMVAGNCDLMSGTEQAVYDEGEVFVFAHDGSTLSQRINGVGAWLKDSAVFAVTQ